MDQGKAKKHLKNEFTMNYFFIQIFITVSGEKLSA